MYNIFLEYCHSSFEDYKERYRTREKQYVKYGSPIFWVLCNNNKNGFWLLIKIT